MQIGTYTYDAWGNFRLSNSSTTVLESYIVTTYNPFRYRGYWYDIETGLYYLQSRYYNPTWGRFLNADSALYHNMLGYNMYLYCNNNPVNFVDYTGTEAITAMATIGRVLFVVAVVCVLYDFTHERIIEQAFFDALDGIVDTIDTIRIIANAIDNGDSDTEFDDQGRPIVTPDEPPSEEDGYHPPKGGPKKGSTKKGGKKGWVDDHGNIWVPAPTGHPTAHGGGHWDVNRGDGRGYANVYPGGKIRPGKGRIPIF